MKFIPFSKSSVSDTSSIIQLVLRDATNSGGVNYEEQGVRIDLIKKFKANDKPEGIVVDNDEFALISRLITTYKFGVADEGVYEIIGQVKSAKEPPAVMIQKTARSK